LANHLELEKNSTTEEEGLVVLDNPEQVLLEKEMAKSAPATLLVPSLPSLTGTATSPNCSTPANSSPAAVMRMTDHVVTPPTNEQEEEYNPGAYLLLRDLQGNGNLPMPVNATEVYERNVTVAKDKLSQLRKIVRYGIFPMNKFVNFENNDEKRVTWDYVKDFKNGVGEDNIPGDVMKALKILEKGEMICAVYWNTYKGEVLKTFSQTRSTIMSNMKRSIVPGETFIESN
jgi:hypothetical protein